MPRKRNQERDDAIIKLREAGKSYYQIASLFKLHKTAIAKTLRRNGRDELVGNLSTKKG